MGRATTADKVIGTILIIFGACGAIATALSPVLINMAKSAGQPTGPLPGAADIAVGSIGGLVGIIGGIGMWLGARWGHMLVVLMAAIGIVWGVKGILMPAPAAAAAGPMAVIGPVIGMLVDLALGGYCLWRLTSDKP